MSLFGESASGARACDVSHDATAHACGSCGALARRAGARFCSTCGGALGEGYHPADSLRASYRFERPRETFGFNVTAPRAARRRGAWRRPSPKSLRGEVASKSLKGEVMFLGNRDGVTSSAFAFVAYALVPYLGILFCPGALLFGGVGLVRSLRSPNTRARRDSALGLALGILILCAQLLLWWILYKVPEWTRQANL